MDEDIEHLKVTAGLETVQLGSVGAQHFNLSGSPSNMATFSVITQPGPKVLSNNVVYIENCIFNYQFDPLF